MSTKLLLLSEAAPQPSSLELIRKRPLAKLLKVSPWTIDRWRKLGTFPSPIKLSETTLVWRMSEIEAWLRARAEGGSDVQ